MRILFICSSLEPGRDGVGDYVRRLGAELIRQGYRASAMALNDKFVGSVENEIQYDNKTGLTVLRLPASGGMQQKIDIAKTYINKFNPDWLSLQFVIFGYHPRGLPFGIEKHFQTIVAGRRLHIMFHEIWVGITRKSPLKHKIYGFLQQRIIKKLIRTLHPRVITTTNGLYQAVLKSRHIYAEIIPLFSNIPVLPRDEAFIRAAENVLGISAGERSGYYVAGVFGSLYPGAGLEKAITQCLDITREHHKKLVFIAVGRLGAEGISIFEQLQQQFGQVVRFYSFGERPPEIISQLLGMMDAGVSCTPAEHIGKSGAYAAMRAHGLDVYIPGNNFVPEYDAVIKNYHHQLLDRRPREWEVDDVASVFVKSLQEHGPEPKSFTK